MTVPALIDVECASIPAAAMGRLAPLRGRPGVELALHDRTLWVRWPAGHDYVACRLMAIPKAQLYVRREGRWYALGRSIPAFEVPASLKFRPLDQVLFPALAEPTAPDRFTVEPSAFRLVADATVRPTTAMACSLAELIAWASTMPGCAVERAKGARCGPRVFVLGKKLPWIEGGERFWGRTVFVPLGLRPEPDWPEDWLRDAFGIFESDLLVLRPAGGEIIAHDHFAPLSLASLRLAAEEEGSP